jgi:glycyl-tRNA synthetase beta subunit
MKTVADEILSLLLTPPPEIAPHVARWGPRISGEKDLSHSLLEHWMTLLKEARISGKDNHTVLPSGLTSFLKDRLSAILVQKGFPSPWVRGAVDTLHFNPLQAFQRLNALKEWAHSHDLVSLLDTYKRFRNIARDVEMPDILSTPRFFEATEGVEPGERAFAETLIQTGSKLMNLLESHPLQALTLLGDLVPVAEGLFQTVRIEHPDPVLRRRRKSVVAFARALFLRYINWDRLLEG